MSVKQCPQTQYSSSWNKHCLPHGESTNIPHKKFTRAVTSPASLVEPLRRSGATALVDCYDTSAASVLHQPLGLDVTQTKQLYLGTSTQIDQLLFIVRNLLMSTRYRGCVSDWLSTLLPTNRLNWTQSLCFEQIMTALFLLTQMSISFQDLCIGVFSIKALHGHFP